MTIALISLQTVLVLLTAPLMVGLIRKCKARFQNRRGASVLLPYVTLFSQLKKEMTITRHSSWVFHVVPFVVLGCAIALAILTPTFAYGILPDFASNIFMVGALLAFGSVFLVFGGMDTGSTFGNMGSSREMTLASLVEPTVYVSLTALGVVASSWSLDGILAHFALSTWSETVPFAGLSLLAFLLVILAENARYPVDNPATHLELTMVHEAMLIEYSGPYLALLEYAGAIKLTAMTVFLANLVLPFALMTPGLSILFILIGIIAFIAKLALGAFVIGFIESTIVKMRFYRMQEYMSLAFVIALGGLVLALIKITL